MRVRGTDKNTAAEMEAAATTSLAADDLDHLLELDGATQVYPENCVADSIIAKIISKGDPADPSTYSCVTDSLEMQSDKLGAFSGDGGAAQDDSIKASLDLAHTDLDAILAGAAGTGEGVTQVITKAIDLNQAAAAYDLFTGSTQAVIIQGIIAQCPDDVAGGALTSVSIQTDHTTNQVFINAVDGAVANLTAEAQLSWDGHVYLDVGNKIRLTIGGGAEGAEYLMSIHAICVAAANGGTLTVA